MEPPHERLLVYQKARDAAKMCLDLSLAIPATRRDLADQLRRASSSVSCNIAEGAAEFSPKEKIRVYRIARRSACECFAIMDLIEHAMGPTARSPEIRGKLNETLALLANTMRSLEKK